MHVEIYQDKLSGSSRTEAMPSVPKTKTPIERVSSSLSDARELSYRVRNMVNVLIGSLPEPAGGEASLVSDGLVIALADNAEDAASAIRQAQDDLSRLSKVLGLAV
jgi:hypothetical protein